MFNSIHRVSVQGATLSMAQAVQGDAAPNGLTAALLFPVSIPARAAACGVKPR
jgi:hypothetical protein